MLSILRICYRSWEEHPKFDMLLTGAKWSKQHGNQNGGKKKDSCASESSGIVQLNKSKVLFHVVFLAAPLHTLYIALFLPTVTFPFDFCGIRKKTPHWPEFE